MRNAFPYGRFGSQLSGVVGHPRQSIKRPLPEAVAPPSYKRPRLDPRANAPMPRSYTATRRPVRRTRRRRPYRRGVIRRPIPRALTAPTKLVKMKAVQYVNHANTAALSNTDIQITSFDDPFGVTNAGQPLGYDQWKALYRKAYVIGAKVVARVHNNGTSAVMVGITPMKPAQGTTALANYEYYMELPSTKARILSPDVDHMVLAHKVSPKWFLPVTKIRDNDDLLVNLVTETPPSTLCYFHVWSQPLDEAAAYDVDLVLTAEYMILLVDPIVPARSTET